jgi:hypothetical protein
MRRRPTIERRSRVFLGCEGESEQAYGAFLQRVAEENGIRVHILPANLRPAGDPLALAEKAIKVFSREEKKGGFLGKVIILDADRLNDLLGRGQKALRLLASAGFTTVWQRPDHEGLLLRHFVGHEYDDPPRGASMDALRAVWPEYRKNMPSLDLKRKLTLADVGRAAATTPELSQLLRIIGFT